MRLLLLTWIVLLFFHIANGQEKKPVIVGQKSLSTNQGKPITIQLTDLYVEEHDVGGGNHNNDDEDDDGGGSDDKDEDNDDDENNDSDDDDNEDDEDEDHDNDDNNDVDKGKDKDKGKGKGKDKDKGKDRGDDDRVASYPAGYALEVFSGPHYSISGTTVTPAPDFTGVLAVDVRVRNNEHPSPKYPLKITVIAVDEPPQNKPPVITGHLPLTTFKNLPLQVKLSDLQVTDPDDQYPEGFALSLMPGEHYTVQQTTVYPSSGFVGTLTVPAVVNDGKANSQPFNLIIRVTVPENIAPVITGQLTLTTTINTSITVLLSHLKVADPDNSYPADFTMKILSGAHYTAQENVVAPTAGFTGPLIVPVTVNDGTSESPPFDLTIQVVPNENIRPAIIGQLSVIISQDQSVRIVLSQIFVQDPDNQYPADFSLQVFPGEHYSASEDLITPDEGFAGDLFVRVAVHDGAALSEIYPFKISVLPAANDKPVITGQAGLKTLQGQSLEIKFSHLVVHDDDNRYPEDFSLQILGGENYTVSGKRITPVPGFLGTLTIMVVVHDGETSSDPFALKVQVVAGDRLEIVSQKLLEVPEDSSLFVSLSDLMVNDPDKVYPQGFTLQMLPGPNYDVARGHIKPDRDFYGNLTVPVTVSGQGRISAAFSLLVVVTPVNDAPELLNASIDPVAVSGSGPWPLATGTEVHDVDDDHLLFAEIGFDLESYQRGVDRFEFEPGESIHAVFDEDKGVLFLLGRAPLGDYQDVIRSVGYQDMQSTDSVQLPESKRVYIRLNDGKDTSPEYERLLLFEPGLALEIPSAFTPNNDQANDTWKITPGDPVEKLNAFIRVYDKNGNMVFETTRLDNEWDGYYEGAPLPADVYFYTIEMDLSYKKVKYKGIVAILR